MPRRRVIIATGETYHTFNRSVGKIPIFKTTKDYGRAIEVFSFYSYSKPPLRFSRYRLLPKDQRVAFLENLQINHPKIVELIAFCLMPNHFHFLIRETFPKGISTVMRNFQNSYAKYFNTKSERTGALFQSMFKAIRIETEEQLLHVCRYIHLNPITSYLVEGARGLDNYNWSSWVEYNRLDKHSLVNASAVLSHFLTIEKFRSFTLDQADYQRTLEEIKHLTFD